MTTIVTQTVTMARITYTKTAGRRAGSDGGGEERDEDEEVLFVKSLYKWYYSHK